MADEGEHIHIENQSNAGKWILLLLGILAVAAFGYATYLTHSSIRQLNQDLAASQAQVKELQNRMHVQESSVIATRSSSAPAALVLDDQVIVAVLPFGGGVAVPVA